MIKKEQVYSTEWESVVLHEVESQVNSLPTEIVEFYIGPSRGNLRIVSPTFEIRPVNRRAAHIIGTVLQAEGVVIGVGHSRRELGFRGINTAEALACASQVSRICRAVFAGNFSESLHVDRSGRVISSCLRLNLDDGTEFRMWQNRLLADLLKCTRKREVSYAPYTDKGL